jgi:hypothetical protein
MISCVIFAACASATVEPTQSSTPQETSVPATVSAPTHTFTLTPLVAATSVAATATLEATPQASHESITHHAFQKYQKVSPPGEYPTLAGFEMFVYPDLFPNLVLYSNAEGILRVLDTNPDSGGDTQIRPALLVGTKNGVKGIVVDWRSGGYDGDLKYSEGGELTVGKINEYISRKLCSKSNNLQGTLPGIEILNDQVVNLALESGCQINFPSVHYRFPAEGGDVSKTARPLNLTLYSDTVWTVRLVDNLPSRLSDTSTLTTRKLPEGLQYKGLALEQTSQKTISSYLELKGAYAGDGGIEWALYYYWEYLLNRLKGDILQVNTDPVLNSVFFQRADLNRDMPRGFVQRVK